MNLRHPLAHVRGLGSAKDGTHHWWAQRLTAVALALLSPWFLCLALAYKSLDHAAIRADLAEPVNATLMLSFVLALFWHAKLGLQVVIEDYIHIRWMEVGLQIFVQFACALGALFAAIAIGRIAFSA